MEPSSVLGAGLFLRWLTVIVKAGGDYGDPNRCEASSGCITSTMSMLMLMLMLMSMLMSMPMPMPMPMMDERVSRYCSVTRSYDGCCFVRDTWMLRRSARMASTDVDSDGSSTTRPGQATLALRVGETLYVDVPRTMMLTMAGGESSSSAG